MVDVLVLRTIVFVLVGLGGGEVVVVVVEVRVCHGGQRREEVLEEVVVAGHVKALVLNSMLHPPYRQSASQGAIKVAVGIDAGHPHGLRTVLTKAQSVNWHVLPHPRFCIVRVTVGQGVTSGAP